MRSIVLVLLLAGCAARPAPPAGPAIVLDPPRPAPARLSSDIATAAPAAAIRRDTAALERQVRGYVFRPDSKPELINELSTLLLQTRQAVQRMERNRRKGLFRTPDITAARVAADSLAAFLQTRLRPALPVPAEGAALPVAAPIEELLR